jgi:cell wall-associated NlpC family hydrolase
VELQDHEEMVHFDGFAITVNVATSGGTMKVIDYIGLPFYSGGREKSGLDCWGLIRLVYKEQFNIDLPIYDGMDGEKSEAREIAACIHEYKSAWLEVERGSEQEGDIIILRINGWPMHIGVVFKKGSMLHIMKGMNAVLEKYTSPKWEKRIFAFVRHKELT